MDFQRLKPKYDKLLSIFPFNLNLRPSDMGAEVFGYGKMASGSVVGPRPVDQKAPREVTVGCISPLSSPFKKYLKKTRTA